MSIPLLFRGSNNLRFPSDAVLEYSRHNLLNWSEDLTQTGANGGWSPNANVSIVSKDTCSLSGSAYQSLYQTIQGIRPGQYTFSWLGSYTGVKPGIRVYSPELGKDLLSTTSEPWADVAVGSWRSKSFTVPTGVTYIYVYPISSNGGTSTVTLSKMQLHAGSLPKFYQYQGSPQEVFDTSGNGNHGILGASSGNTTGDPVSHAYGWGFDGVDDKIMGPVLPASSEGYTYICVASFTKPDAYQAIMDNKVSGSTNRGLSLELDNSGRVKGRISDGNTQAITATSKVLIDGKAHILFFRARSEDAECTLFVDGDFVGKAKLSSTMPSFASSLPLYIGSHSTGSYLGGSVYYAAAFKRPLSDKEMKAAQTRLLSRFSRLGIPF